MVERNRKNRMVHWPLIMAGLSMGLASCAAAVQPAPDEDEPVPMEEAPPPDAGEPDRVSPSGTVNLGDLTPVPGEEGNVVQPAPGIPDPSARVVQLAKQDLAGRAGRDLSEVELVSIEAVDWPDASLGCPLPGEGYAQVITPGYRMVLELDGLTYPYHSNREARVVLCAADQ